MRYEFFGTGHGIKGDSLIYVGLDNLKLTQYIPNSVDNFLLDVGSRSIIFSEDYILKDDRHIKYVLITHGHGDHIGGLGHVIGDHFLQGNAVIMGPMPNNKTRTLGIGDLVANTSATMNLTEEYKGFEVREIFDKGIVRVIEYVQEGSQYIIFNDQLNSSLPGANGVIPITRNSNFKLDVAFGGIHSSSQEHVLAYALTELVYSLKNSSKSPLKSVDNILKKLQIKAYREFSDQIRDRKDLEDVMLSLHADAVLKSSKRGVMGIISVNDMSEILASVTFLYGQNKLTYITDTPYLPEKFKHLSANSDVLICGTPRFSGIHQHHLTGIQAADIAVQSRSKELILMHLGDFSHSLYKSDNILFSDKSLQSAENEKNAIREINEQLSAAQIKFSVAEAKPDSEVKIRNPLNILE